jgi:hypothetical protein
MLELDSFVMAETSGSVSNSNGGKYGFFCGVCFRSSRIPISTS